MLLRISKFDRAKNYTMRVFQNLLLLGLLMLFATVAFSQKKIALIVAVGKYPANQRDWNNLSSERDCQYIKEALLQNGFLLKDIDTLINSQATKAAMISSLDKLAEKAKPGDVVYFHFSGHGQQIQDDAKDGYLDEMDGYDEALIPYDAKGKWDAVDYHGEKHFRDDLLAEKLNAIRKKVGVNGSVVVVVDACHSGTITRSAGIKRGTPIPCQKPGYKPDVSLNNITKTENSFLESGSTDLGSLVVFSGSSPNQENKEMNDDNGKSVGALSYAFAKAISNLSPNCNYQLLFEKIKATIQAEEPTQIPMFEGNAALKVFANQFIPISEIIIANQIFNNKENNFNDTTFIINKGAYNNITVGTSLKLVKQGFADVYTNAIVKEVNNFSSVCIAQKKLLKSDNYEVKIEDVMYGKIMASFLIQNKAKANELEKQLKNFLKPKPFLGESNNPDYTISIEQAGSKYSLLLIEKNDSIRYSKNILVGDTLSNVDLENIVEDIKQGMRIKYLRKLDDGGSLAKFVSVNIVPVKARVGTSEMVFATNEDFNIVLKNNFDNVLYYTILDLTPDNKIKVLIPDSLDIAADYSLRKGQEIKYLISTDSTSVTGKEFLKVIFSPTPLDLRPSFSATTRRGSNSKPLERMMDELFTREKNIKTRSTALKLDDIGIVTVGFTLKK